MKRTQACNLGVGDTINLHPTLAVQTARVMAIKPYVTRNGTVLVFDLECAGGTWSGAKASFGFLADEKVNYIPLKKAFREHLWSFLSFFNFTR